MSVTQFSPCVLVAAAMPASRATSTARRSVGRGPSAPPEPFEPQAVNANTAAQAPIATRPARETHPWDCRCCLNACSPTRTDAREHLAAERAEGARLLRLRRAAVARAGVRGAGRRGLGRRAGSFHSAVPTGGAVARGGCGRSLRLEHRDRRRRVETELHRLTDARVGAPIAERLHLVDGLRRADVGPGFAA